MTVEGRPQPLYWCPTYLVAERPGAKESLDRVVAPLSLGCAGLYLDWEGPGTSICYCHRCRDAFVKATGLGDVKWPDDVRAGGRYFEPYWVEFRIAHSTGPLRNPSATDRGETWPLLGSYSGWSCQGSPAGHAEIENYRYGYGADVAEQVGLLDFFAPGFYAYADGADAGFVETLIRMRRSIGKSPLSPYLCDEWLLPEKDYWRPNTLFPFELVRLEAGVALGVRLCGHQHLPQPKLRCAIRRAGEPVRLAASRSAGISSTPTSASSYWTRRSSAGSHWRRSKDKVWCVLVPALAQTRPEIVSVLLRARQSAVPGTWTRGDRCGRTLAALTSPCSPTTSSSANWRWELL